VEKIAEKIFSFRVIILVVTVVLTAFLGFKASSIKLYDDPNEWPPPNHRNVILNQEIQDVFGGANVVIIQTTVKEGDIFNPETLNKVKRISEKILLIKGVVPYYLTSLAARKVRYMKGTYDFLDISFLMDTVPETPEEMERLKFGVYHNPTIYGPLVSLDSKSTIIIADFRTGKDEEGNLKKLPRTTPIKIYQEINKIIEPENDDNTFVTCTGSPIIIGWVGTEGLKRLFMAFCSFFIVMCVVLGFTFRNIRGIFFPILLGVCACIWAFGLQVLIWGETLRSASGFLVPFIIMAAAACHSVQFLKRYAEEKYSKTQNLRSAIANTFTALIKPITLALTTDALAFGVLCFVPFVNVSLVGSLGCLGLVSLFIVMIGLFIPLLFCFPGQVEKKGLITKESRVGKIEWLEKAAALLVSSKAIRWTIALIALVLVIVTSLMVTRFDFGQDNTYAIHNFLTRSWKNNPVYKMEMNIKDKFKGIYPCNILIDTKKEDGLKDPDTLKKIANFSDHLNKLPEVAGCMDLSMYIKLMHRFMNCEDPKHFVVPDRKRAIAEYLYMYSLGEAGSFGSVVNYDYRKAVIAVFVDSTDHKTVAKVLKAAREYAEKNFNDGNVVVKIAGGAIGVTDAFNESIEKWIFLAFLLSVATSFIAIAVLFRSFMAAVFLIVSPILATFANLVLLSLSGIEMNSNVSLIVAMGIGVGVDAGIYLLLRFREEFSNSKDFKQALMKSFNTAGKANIFSYVALVVGCWSVIPVPLYVGYVGYGMGMVLFLNLIFIFAVLGAMMVAFKPRFLISK